MRIKVINKNMFRIQLRKSHEADIIDKLIKADKKQLKENKLFSYFLLNANDIKKIQGVRK